MANGCPQASRYAVLYAAEHGADLIPGYIEVIGRFGNQKEVYWVPPGTKFLTIKVQLWQVWSES